MAITNIDNHNPKSRHRGWSTHIASRRYRLAQPNRSSSRSFVTPGGIGTHRIHPPRKRIAMRITKLQRQQPQAIRHARADAAAGPYAEICVLNSLLKRWNQAHDTMHPPRERIHIDSTLHTATTSYSSLAGGHGGPPLRGGFVSIRGITKAEPNIKQEFRNARRHRHAHDASAAQANCYADHEAPQRATASNASRAGCQAVSQ